MASNEDLTKRRFALNNGSAIPALGFGTSLSDNRKTEDAVKTAVEVGFRHLDAAERYRNEAQVGTALKELFANGTVRREDMFVTTKLWNNNHRPERVKPALQASLDRLGLDAGDLYLVHTPFAFQPGDDQDPRHPHGDVIYDDGITLEDTWAAMESLVDEGPACPISTPTAPGRSSTPRESSRQSWKWSRIHITRNGNSMNCARRMGPFSWHSRGWDTRLNHDCLTTLSSCRSLSVLKRRLRKCFWPGVFSAAPRSSRGRSLRRASGRTSMFLRFRKVLSKRSASTKPGSDSIPLPTAENRDSPRCLRIGDRHD
jgi:hypothetical protein